jgi:hypothetical protein
LRDEENAERYYGLVLKGRRGGGDLGEILVGKFEIPD